MSSQTRHEQLIQAGWIYDSASDRYRAPGSAEDGTAKMHNLDAAWLAFQASQLDSASQGTPPKGTRQADPRIKESE